MRASPPRRPPRPCRPSICPVCEGPKRSNYSELNNLLTNIADEKLLFTLDCDFAARVCALAPNPTQTEAWLQVARDWETNPAAVEKAAAAADEACDNIPETEMAARCALEAVRFAMDTARKWALGISARPSSGWAAGYAVGAMRESGADSDAEIAWQLQHAKGLACHCPVLPEASPSIVRNRNSLLAG